MAYMERTLPQSAAPISVTQDTEKKVAHENPQATRSERRSGLLLTPALGIRIPAPATVDESSCQRKTRIFIEEPDHHNGPGAEVRIWNEMRGLIDSVLTCRARERDASVPAMASRASGAFSF
jgi:hypothetical protein